MVRTAKRIDSTDACDTSTYSIAIIEVPNLSLVSVDIGNRQPSTTTLIGLFTRDPIGFEGSEWDLYEYCSGRSTNAVDPRGLIMLDPGTGLPWLFPGAGGPGVPSGPVLAGRCRVSVECTPLVIFGATHCGIRIEDSNGRSDIHIGGADGKCTFVNGPVQLGPIPSNYSSWWGAEYDISVCDCIRATRSAIDSLNLTYNPIPSNGCDNDNPPCNSNYATKCLLSNCGVARRSTGLSIADPVGWNFRRQVCTNRRHHASVRSISTTCQCDSWKYVDESYCSEAATVTPHSLW